MDWLDKLSGPGPFTNAGLLLDFRLFCEIDVDRNLNPLIANLNPPPDGRQNAFGEQTVWVAPSFKRGDSLGRQCLTGALANNKTNLVKSYLEVRGGRISTPRQPLFSDVPGELIGTVAATQVMGIFMRQVNPLLAVGAGAGVIWFSGDNVDGHPSTSLSPLLAPQFHRSS